MTLTLTKHHGLANDFLVLFDPPGTADLASLARALCDRRRGIGADGLLVGTDAVDGAVRMILYNADGSRAETSGNGARCFAQAVAMRRGHPGDVSILTDAGERVVTLHSTDDPATLRASVDMGPVDALDEPEGWLYVGAHPDRPVAHVGIGNPHTVVGVADVTAVELAALGAKVAHVNLEIVEPGPEPHAVTMRVHERGAGITEACGSGACAAAWASARWGLAHPVDGEIVVHMPGGDATVVLDEPVPGHLTLIGPATYVATITVILPRPPGADGEGTE